MKCGSVLINCVWGGFVDEVVLVEFLIVGYLGGAGFDVFENESYKGPLTVSENVVLIMYMGSYVKGVRIVMEMEVVENLLCYFLLVGG